MFSRRPSPGTVISVVALFIALSSTSYAITRPSPRTVGVAQLKTGSVTRAKLRNNAVNSAKVAPASLQASDFAPGQIPTGPQGSPGPPGVAQVVEARGAVVFAGQGQVFGTQAFCPAGSFAVGGGWDGGDNPSVDNAIGYNNPIGQTWGVVGVNYDSGATFQAVARCVSGPGLTTTSTRARDNHTFDALVARYRARKG